jgi:uncharacterized membrane protein YqjE
MAAQSWYSQSSSYGSPASSGNADNEPEDDRPLGELFSDLSRSVQTLVRNEIELAKVEVKEQAGRAGKAAAMLTVAGVVGFLAIVLLSFAAAWGLAEGVPTWLGFLAVGLLYGAIAGLLLVVGKKKLATVKPVPKQAVDTLREDVEVAKTSLSRGAQY